MPFVLSVPNEYGYVLLVATSTFFLNSIHAQNTGKYRKLSKIGYPAAYATPEQVAKDPAANQLNCAQRAHANYTENHISTLMPLLIAGLRFPVPAAILGALWTVGRYLYMVGYCDPAKPNGVGRYRGAVQYIGTIGLVGLLIYQSVEMIIG